MARASSRSIMGFLKIDNHHHDAIISLIAPATPAHRLLDPFAGEGEFLEVASQQEAAIMLIDGVQRSVGQSGYRKLIFDWTSPPRWKHLPKNMMMI